MVGVARSHNIDSTFTWYCKGRGYVVMYVQSAMHGYGLSYVRMRLVGLWPLCNA